MDAVGLGGGVHLLGNALIDGVALRAVFHVDDVRLGQSAHAGFQHAVGDGIQPLLRLGGGAQGLVEQLRVGDVPQNVAVHGHILLVGGEHLGGRNVVELGGLGEILHAVHKGHLEVQTGLVGGVDDLGKPHGAGVLILPDGEGGAGRKQDNKHQHDDQNYLFLHFSLPPSASTRDSSGRSICTSPPSAPVLMYSFTPGSTWEMAS